MEAVTEEDQVDVLNHFLNLNTKDQQDLFLQSLIDVNDIKHRRPRTEDARTNCAAFTYHVMVGTDRVQVCFKAFLSLHSVTKKRVERIRALKMFGKSPVDKRGLHVKKSMSEETKLKIREHIESFPTKESHYLGRPIKYLDATLNIKTMYSLFKEKYPLETVGLTFFFNFFNEHYNLKFGRPQVDICCVCEELRIKLKSPHLNDAAKRCAQAELHVHKRKTKKFFCKIKTDTEDKQNDNILCLSFDFMQNVQIPKIPVQETFYLRQLSVNLFCIHNLKTNKADIYLYHQGTANKGPNEVCSFLLHYLNHLDKQYNELHLYSDNCWGQNKNHPLSRFLSAITELKLFDKVEQYYPIRGHSFLPCDRDFSIIKRELRKNDRLYTVDQISDFILKSSKNEKFVVHKVTTQQILDFKSWWPVFYKKKLYLKKLKVETPPNNRKYSSQSVLLCTTLTEVSFLGKLLHARSLTRN
ncbi:uncharacterized protein LOC124370567 [Homalodisca vitripennis]|uniref:uncharacterized protein LOC124370567 n=1 Tax=Homalodisca vitripennis TaxID=197043 RepID=UPI001EEAEADB|nr:uncharacterized protein LOC124370567 [Homalodisca vitripennis]